MPALLYCRTGPMSGASFSLAAETTVGRTAENSVTLSDDRISSRHARIWPDPESGEWMLEDLGSSNGTLVDGTPVAEAVALGDLSVVTFAGRFDFIFQVTTAASAPVSAGVSAPSPAAQASDDVATRPGGAPPPLPNEKPDEKPADDGVRTMAGGAAPSLPDVDAPADDDVRTRVGGGAPALPDMQDSPGDDDVRTRVGGAAPDLPDTGAAERDDGTKTRAGGAPPGLPHVSGESAQPATDPPAAGPATLHIKTSETVVTDYELQPGANVVGRSSDADIRIDDASLSRSHAVITLGDGRITVRDDGSKNGTWIDGEKVTGERPVTANNRLRFGFRIEAWVSRD